MMSAALIAAALSAGASPPTDPTYWFNLRGSGVGPTGFIGDGSTSTYSTGLIHPENTIGGLTGGWVAAAGGGILVDIVANAAFEHQAGRAPLNAGTDARTYRISGLTPGEDYEVFLSMGGPTATITSQIAIYSGNRVNLLHTTPSVSILNGQFADAEGTVFADIPAWIAGQQGQVITTTTDSFYFCRGATSTGYLTAIGVRPL